MAERPGLSPAERRGAFALVLLLAGITLAVTFSSLLPARRDAHRTRTLLDEQRERNRALAVREGELRDEIEALEHDPWTIQRVQRDEFNLAEPGEVRVR